MKASLDHVEAWLSKEIVLNKDLTQDISTLQLITEQEAKFLAALPIKPKRNIEQQVLADKILLKSRALRNQFIAHHAHECYAILTHHFSRHLRLNELVYEAAQQFPGLVPTSEQMAHECQFIQAHKEGLEIDQGIFFRGLLRVPTVAQHLSNAMLLPTTRALSLLTAFQQEKSIDLGTVLIEKVGKTAYLTLNHLHCLNAEDNRFVEDMETAVDLTLLDEQITVGVLRGGVMTHPRYKGQRVFCAGINLSALYAGKISLVEFLLTREFGFINKIAYGLIKDLQCPDWQVDSIQKPWIAAVDGFAIGGGMQFLLVFDKIIAQKDAYFILPAAKEGIIPGAANFRLPQILGDRLARQLILFGRKINATDQEASLLCDEVVSSLDMERAIENAIQALDNPAVIENRKMLNLTAQFSGQFSQYMAEFAYSQAMRLYSADVLSKIETWVHSRKSGEVKEKARCF